MSDGTNIGYYADRLAVPAVRYALGRRSYVVESVAIAVSGLLPHMSTRSLAVLERDVREALDGGRAGDECDVFERRRLLERVAESLADRQEDAP